MTLDRLRGRLTDRQRAVLDDVWSHMKEKGVGLPERPLLDKFGREELAAVTEDLGGSIIYSGHEENKLRYKLDLVGAFLTSDGPRLETLAQQYLQYLKSRY